MPRQSPEGRTHWAGLRATSEAEIEAIAAEDAENPVCTSEGWAQMSVALPLRRAPAAAMSDADTQLSEARLEPDALTIETDRELAVTSGTSRGLDAGAGRVVSYDQAKRRDP